MGNAAVLGIILLILAICGGKFKWFETNGVLPWLLKKKELEYLHQQEMKRLDLEREKIKKRPTMLAGTEGQRRE